MPPWLRLGDAMTSNSTAQPRLCWFNSCAWTLPKIIKVTEKNNEKSAHSRVLPLSPATNRPKVNENQDEKRQNKNIPLSLQIIGRGPITANSLHEWNYLMKKIVGTARKRRRRSETPKNHLTSNEFYRTNAPQLLSFDFYCIEGGVGTCGSYL